MSTNQANYRKNQLSLIVTVFNEEKSILALLNSYKKQSLLADEFIIVDAESKDRTVALINNFSKANPKLKIKVFKKKGGRSVGRNFAVEKARGKWIAITDAGCILDKNWLRNLKKTTDKTKLRIVAGYYQGTGKKLLQEAFAPYFLVMPNQLRKVNQFLPATRSMLIDKNLWNQLGALDEDLEVAEDYQMAIRIKKQGEEIAFAKEAIVYWESPQHWGEFWKKTSSFAAGDFKGKVFRKKVYLIFLRYFLGMFLAFYNLSLLSVFIFLYILWSIWKNYKNCPRSWFYLPFVQIFSDLAVIWGTSTALIQ